MTQLTETQKHDIMEIAGKKAIEEAQNDLDSVIVMKPFRAFVLKALMQNVSWVSKKGANKGIEEKRTTLNVLRLISLINKADPTSNIKFKSGGYGNNLRLELETYDPKYTR